MIKLKMNKGAPSKVKEGQILLAYLKEKDIPVLLRGSMFGKEMRLVQIPWTIPISSYPVEQVEFFKYLEIEK